jgi:hypothetical protein
MIHAIAAVVLLLAAATRFRRWRARRSLVLAGSVVILVCMSLHMAINVQQVEDAVRSATGDGMPTAVKMLLVCGICVGTAIVFTDVTAQHERHRKLLVFHVATSIVLAILAFVVFYRQPWPDGVTDREFDRDYAFLPGYADGLALGMVYPFLLCAMVTVVAIVQADRRTITGRTLLLIVPGAAILTTYAGLRIGYLVAARFGVVEPTTTPLEITRFLAAAGAFLLAAGVLAGLAMNRRQARRALPQFANLHRELLSRWPGTQRESRPHSSEMEKVDDRAVEVMDALSLEADFSSVPRRNPFTLDDRAADLIAQWLVTGEAPPELGHESLSCPPGVITTDWVCSLGRAYDRATHNERKMVS